MRVNALTVSIMAMAFISGPKEMFIKGFSNKAMKVVMESKILKMDGK
jgi:hypothetical protein